jgi:hypothetical protein
MFSKDGPHAWNTKKGNSRIDREVEVVASTQAKVEARASIEQVIAEEKTAIGERAVETKTETV